MSDFTYQYTDLNHDLGRINIVKELFMGSVQLTATDQPAISVSKPIPELTPAAGKQYLLVTSTPSEVFVGKPSDSGQIGPIDLGGVVLTLSADGVVTLENKVYIGKRPGPYLKRLYIEFKEISISSGSGSGSGGNPDGDEWHEIDETDADPSVHVWEEL